MCIGPICLSKPAFNIYICFFGDSINYSSIPAFNRFLIYNKALCYSLVVSLITSLKDSLYKTKSVSTIYSTFEYQTSLITNIYQLANSTQFTNNSQ